MKRDGHTHTEYCPHGEVKDTEELIQKAIQLGFTDYSITEHAPIPDKILKCHAAGNRDVWDTAAMSANDVEHYLKRMHDLKEKYSSDINIHIGFELDYFKAAEDWSKDFLNEYGQQLDDGVLSVHFLEGSGGLRGVDHSFKEYKEGLVDYHGSFQATQTLYYETVIQSLKADLGIFKPKRLGHITLCQKFEKQFNEDITLSKESLLLVQDLYLLVKQHSYELDLNTAGYDKEAYQKSYPTSGMIKQAIALNIPLVYGSDSHALSDVGRYFDDIVTYL